MSKIINSSNAPTTPALVQKYTLVLTYELGKGIQIQSDPQNLDSILAQAMLRGADTFYDVLSRKNFEVALAQQNRLVRATGFPPPPGMTNQ